MKIVVLDGYTNNPGDLSWDGLKALGECTIHGRTAPEQIIPRTAEAEIILTNKTVLSAKTIDRLTKLKYIGVLATGYNIVDVEAARRRGVPVSNVPTYATQSVAQMVFAHLLNLTLNVAHHARTVREGRWVSSVDFCYWDTPLVELQGLTMGIIGFGRIGRATAMLARAFGMNVIVSDVTTLSEIPDGCRVVELEDIFRDSDVVSLHCPLTPQTQNIVNTERLALMKPTAYLINTSRGPLIDEQALADALNNDRIAGAGVDVLSIEPPKGDNPLLAAKNCHITPHIAWATRAARERLLKIAVDNVAAFLAGKPQNVVNR
ncbi:MAG: glycerate dehydrogenase [Planctomycetes bacterium RBG_16_55_9]|nr:MAG: glycerate dehydrogenase [Planctomycetes bacterium RBG_16_55_9]